MRISFAALLALCFCTPAIADGPVHDPSPPFAVLQQADVPLTPIEWQQVYQKMNEQECEAVKSREEQAWHRYGHFAVGRIWRCVPTR